MTEHVTQWLEAYYDGELNSRHAKLIEAHLATCEICQAELENLSILSSLLLEFPKATNLTPAETFTAQVSLQLPRKPQSGGWQKVFRTGWQWAPAGLLAAWVFVQTTFIVSGILNSALRIVPGLSQFAGFTEVTSQSVGLFGDVTNLTGAGFAEIGSFGLDILRTGGPLGWAVTLNLILTLILGLLYLSWLASWWVQKSNGDTNLSKQ